MSLIFKLVSLEGDAMTADGDPTAPDTIVLIHGFWVTPRSWEDWKAHYQAKGYRVLTRAVALRLL
jgi:pimeloyl-ACP methyl ester carboxylesterase